MPTPVIGRRAGQARLSLVASLAVLLLLVMGADAAAWEWSSPQPVSRARESRLTALHEVAAASGRIHLVHARIGPEPRDDRLVVQRSTDGAATWSPERTLFASTDADRYVTPNLAIAASGDGVLVAWRVAGPGRTSLFVRRSLDGGTTWKPAQRLATTTKKRGLGVPALAMAGDVALLAFTDRTDGRLLLRRSADGGATWGDARRMATSRLTIECGRRVLDALPGLAISGSRVHLAWSDGAAGACLASVLRVRSSGDGGRTWGDARIASRTTTYGWPELAARGRLLIAGLQLSDGSFIVVRSGDGGRTFSERRFKPLKGRALGAADVLLPGGSTAWVVWADLAYDGNRVTSSRIRFAASRNGARSWGVPVTVVPIGRRLREATNLVEREGRPVIVYQSGPRDASTADIAAVRAR